MIRAGWQHCLSGFGRSWEETYALVIDDFHYRSQLVGIRTAREDDDSADFDQSPASCGHVGVTHCEGNGAVSRECKLS